MTLITFDTNCALNFSEGFGTEQFCKLDNMKKKHYNNHTLLVHVILTKMLGFFCEEIAPFSHLALI